MQIQPLAHAIGCAVTASSMSAIARRRGDTVQHQPSNSKTEKTESTENAKRNARVSAGRPSAVEVVVALSGGSSRWELGVE
jgi:hypothetical protein